MCRKGEAATAMFFVVRGLCEALLSPDGSGDDVVVRRFVECDYFGEAALLRRGVGGGGGHQVGGNQSGKDSYVCVCVESPRRCRLGSFRVTARQCVCVCVLKGWLMDGPEIDHLPTK